MTVRFGYHNLSRRPYNSWIVGCDDCGRRLHVDSYGCMRDHVIRKGEWCPGSGKQSSEFKERAGRS